MNRTRSWLLAGGGTAALAAVAATVFFLMRPAPNPGVLEASGQVEGTEVLVSARIGGTLETVAVAEGQRVAKGDLIARLSAREISARVDQARSQVKVLQSQVEEIDAQVRGLEPAGRRARLETGLARDVTSHELHRAGEAAERARAEIAAAEAQYRRDAQAYDRYQKLLAQGFVSESYFDDIRARRTASEARVKAAQRAEQEAVAAEQQARAGGAAVAIKEQEIARLGAERERLEAARRSVLSQIEVAGARVTEAEAALADTRIAAPIDGTIIRKLAQTGELAAPGRPIALLVDMDALKVRVYVPERELAKIRLGSPAEILTDAFPRKPFPGRVSEVSEKAEFTPREAHMKDEREKTIFAVTVAVANAGGYLKPGVPVDVRIRWNADASR